MFRRRFLMAAIVAGIATLAGPSTSEAAFRLRMMDESGATWDVDVTDNGAGDSNPLVGAITFIGSIGNWTANVTTGFSEPVLLPGHLDLNSVNASSASGGQLIIELTDTDYTGPAVDYNFEVGGTTHGTASFEAAGTNSNGEFDFSNSTGALLFGSSPFAGSSLLNSGGADPYSLSIRAVITHTSAGSTSFNAALNPVPAPAGLILAATALPFVGLLRRRVRRPEATTAA